MFAALLGSQRLWPGQSLSCSFLFPEENDTTAENEGTFGYLAGTSSPSVVDLSYCPEVCPSGVHTRNYNDHVRQCWSMLEDSVHSSRLRPSPPSPGLGRLVGVPEVAEGWGQAEVSCWQQQELKGEPPGHGCLTATGLSWLLCTSGYELFCFETTPEHKREKKKSEDPKLNR